MLESSVATERIYSFGLGARVQPSEQLFSEATRTLLERIDDLEAKIIALEERNASYAHLEQDMETLAENQLIQLRLINELRQKRPSKTETSRAAKISRYLESRQDHKASFETLKGYLNIDNDKLRLAIKPLLESRRYAVVHDRGDKRKRTLVMLPK